MNGTSGNAGETSWRSSFSDAERAAVIEKLTRILLSISSSSEQNTERIQQIALRFESQVYTAANHKTEYYQIISNKISSIAEKKRIIFAASANAAGSANVTTNPLSNQSFHEGNTNSLSGSSPTGASFPKNFASPNVPNPQMLLMNTLGKGINQQQQQQQQQQPKESIYPVSSTIAGSGETSNKKNPFIPGFPLTSKSQVQIPNGKPSSNLFYQSTTLSNTNNSSTSFHAVNAPVSAPVPIQAPQPKMHYHSTTSTAQLHPQPQTSQQPSQSEKLYAGSLPNLTLNAEEKNAVKKIIDSLKAFIPKIEILITVSNSIGIPMENLKKISNLKDILVKQLELFKNDIFLLSPFMAENLAEHMRKFVTLLLHKVNSHPAAQSIIEKIRKASEGNGIASAASSSSGPNSASSILPSPLNVPSNGNAFAAAASSNSTFKNGVSPGSAAVGIIRESPFKAPTSTTSFSTAAASTFSNSSTSNATKRQQTRSNSTASSGIVHFANSKVNKIPTLGYLKAKCKKKALIPIEYLKSQLQFIHEASNAEIGGHIELEPAVKRLRETLCIGNAFGSMKST
jgi:hypothetical protein